MENNKITAQDLICEAVRMGFVKDPNRAWNERDIAMMANVFVWENGLTVRGDLEITSDMIRRNIGNAIAHSKKNFDHWITPVNDHVVITDDDGEEKTVFKQYLLGWKISREDDRVLIIANNQKKLIRAKGLTDNVEETLGLAEKQGMLEPGTVDRIMKSHRLLN